VPPQGAPQHDPFAYQGIQDVDAFRKHYDQQMRLTMGWELREQNLVWLDFEKVVKVGDESHLLVRLLPDPLNRNPPVICLPISRHSIPVEYVPGDHGQRQVRFRNCFNMPGGPGDCPVCKALEAVKVSGIEGAAEAIKRINPETTVCWQCINLKDPSVHWVQEVDADGNPKIDPHTRQPVWKIVPAIIRMKKTLADGVLGLMRMHKDPTHLTLGYPVLLVRKKDGPHQMNVKYSAVNGEKGPIDQQLHSIVRATVDLEKELKVFFDREHMDAIANNILARFGLRAGGVAGAPQLPGGQWLPHPQQPGWEFNPHTQAVRPVQQPAPAPLAPALPPPPAVPPAPAPFPQHAPAGPPAASPPYSPPAAPAVGGPPGAPPPPPGLPPAAAPGLPPGPPGAPPGPPMAPPPPPGMPAGAPPGFPTTEHPTLGGPMQRQHAPVGAPPPPPGPPPLPPGLPPPSLGGAPPAAPPGPPAPAMSPAALEQQLGIPGVGGAPPGPPPAAIPAPGGDDIPF
jgi:hypothetical protein